MYKAIIADDEERICLLIEKSVQWEKLQLQHVGSYSNGEALLEAIQRDRPDIVITDIHMPGKSGIQVIQQVRQAGIPCRFVIVSGYREFEYAQNALKYDVDDYLLKPLDEDDLNRTLKRVVDELHFQAATQNPGGTPHFDSNQFLPSLLFEPEKYSQYSIQSVNDTFGVAFRPGYFRIIYIKCDMNTTAGEELSVSSLQKKISQTVLDALAPLCYDVRTTQHRVSDIVVCANYSADKEEEIANCISAMLEQITFQTKIFSVIPTIGVSEKTGGIQDLPICLKQAVTAVRYRLSVGQQRIIYWADTQKPSVTIRDVLSKQLGHTLQQAFETHNTSLFRQTMETISENPAMQNPIVAYHVYEHILSQFRQTAHEENGDPEKGDYLASLVSFEMHNSATFPQLLRSLLEPISDYLTSRQLEDRQYTLAPVRQAQSYVQQHYADAIRTEDVAKHVGLSPAYFSSLFKKETGQGFVDFLTGYRIDVAKDLLQNTKTSIAQVAEQVGYSEQRYFSKLFRREVGIKPTEYRRLHGR